jgi:hypothetical protein
MKALLEGTTADVEQAETGDNGTAAEVAANEMARRQAFVDRCRELLAKRVTDDCPPGHWLG